MIDDLSSSCLSSSSSSSAFMGYFAVFDGHHGAEAANYCNDELHKEILSHISFESNLEEAVTEGCKEIDRKFLDYCEKERLYAGTTALGCILQGSRMLVFGIGDCQAVLCRHNEAVSMNSPHKPGREDERKRVEDACGWITEEKELPMGRLHCMDLSNPEIVDRAKEVQWTTIHRVCGELAVSRSIGDPDYKRVTPGVPSDVPFAYVEGHDRIFNADPVIPDPEFVETILGYGDDFLVIASDGLWDVVSEEDAVRRAASGLARGMSPDQVSEELTNFAFQLGSGDNITVVIVQFFYSS